MTRSNDAQTFSGLYVHELPGALREELRLDVDGDFPQRVASGIARNGQAIAHWVAPLRAREEGWAGRIFFKQGRLPYTHVRIIPDNSSGAQRVIVTLLGRGHPRIETIFTFVSQQFHDVNFEFDFTDDVRPTVTVDTHEHPNHADDLVDEHLTIPEVFKRAGFKVTRNPGNTVSIRGAGNNEAWSNRELNDAMEVAWSRFDTHAQWALWLLTTTRHLEGEGVGGVMFDYMGPVQRQGAAVFNESIFFAAPEGDTSPDAWERRMRFFTTCHEMGHCFNLAHSWQKERIRGLQRHQSVWRGLRNEPQARSFMNYPELVNGGPTAFFRSFGFRFTNQELLFMRHAPPPYVEMGNSTWATGHGARLDVSPHQAFHLEVRANRERPEFEFLEPVVLEIKLKNMSDDEVEIEKHVLETDALTIWITKTNGRRVRFLPLARYCLTPQPQRLGRNESMYRSLFAAVGATGWHIADPGRYAVQAALRVRGESIVSKPFELIVKPPGSSAEEYAAKDFFTADVGRVLAFDGSRVLSRANEALLDMSDRLAYSRMAIHAKVALGCAEAAQSKMLRIDANDKQIVIEPARPESREKLRNTLLMQPEAALETLGHIDYKTYVEWLADRYHEAAEPAMEYECLRTLAQTMSHRQVNRRPIRQSVLDSINRRLAEFQA